MSSPFYDSAGGVTSIVSIFLESLTPKRFRE
jgi:hypothetical protein